MSLNYFLGRNRRSFKNHAVLIVTPFFSPNVGGVETRFDEITKSLGRKAIPTYVLTFQPLITKGVKGRKHEDIDNIHIYRKKWIGMNLFHRFLNYPVLEFLYLVVPVFWNTFWFLLFKKRELNISTVHAAGLNATLALVLLKPLFKFRLVSSTHALYDFNKGRFVTKVMTWMFKHVDLVFAIGEVSKKELVGISVDAEKIQVMPTWVNQDVFKPLDHKECKEKMGLKDEFIIGFVGRLNENKGVRLILRLAKKFEKNKDVVFVIIGTGELDEFVRKQASQCRNVQYLGKIKNYELPKYINAFDIFLTPSQYPEGYARAPVEALSCGVPVLASNRGHLPEIVIEGTGWLVSPTPNAFYEKIKYILKNKAILGKMKEYCAKTSKARFSEKGILKIIEAYKL